MNESINGLVAEVQYDCGEQDRQLISSLYSIGMPVYGLISKGGRVCSNIGGDIAIEAVLAARKDHLIMRVDNFEISRYGLSGIIVSHNEYDKGVLFWVLMPGRFDEALNSPCENCFSLTQKFAGGNLDDYLPDELAEGGAYIYAQDSSIFETILVPSDALDEHVSEQVKKIFVSVCVLFFVGSACFFLFIFFRKRTIYYKLRDALNNNEVIPYYQPVVNSENGLIVGFEMLARWQVGDKETFCQDVFIDVVENSDLIFPMTEKLLLRVIGDMMRLPNDLWVSINISADQLDDGYIFFLLKDLGWPLKKRLFLELTERKPIRNRASSKYYIEQLISVGYEIKLDDFGTGYGGCSYLNFFGFNSVKIDKMFVELIGTGEERIIDGMISFTQDCKLTVIAEGIEKAEQVEYLKSRNIMIHQGYYYHKPMPFKKVFSLYLK
ncbi:EAL domain-containing protein [Aeromonas hydrophila]|uniref:EAL domain-containing protein n=1 Tax=Aeromonas hydrophila TaxID=644 RepID=UPI003EC68F08